MGNNVISTRSGRLRGEMSGDTITLLHFPNTPGCPYADQIIQASVDDFREVFSYLFEMDEQKISDKDVDRIVTGVLGVLAQALKDAL
jgi:hypothetical protein